MNRRQALKGIVAGFSAVALAAFAFPFLRSWLPSVKQRLSLDLNLEAMRVGDARVVKWLGRNVYVVRRDTTAGLPDDETREDPDSERSIQPDYTRNAQRSRKPEHLLVYANCTHLGCEVGLLEDTSFSGFRCPCHDSEFDAAGRVEKGAAAKLNLEVPDYDYIGRTSIRLRKT